MTRIQCACGRAIEVSEGQASGAVQCVCGRWRTVPSLPLIGDAERDCEAGEGMQEEESQERRVLVFLTPPEVLSDRVSFDTLCHYVAACDRLIEAFFGGETRRCDIDLQVAVAVLPGGRKLVEIEVRPSRLPDSARDELVRSLRDLPSPAVYEGPVAFAMRRPVCGGADSAPEFPSPFASLMSPLGDLEQCLMWAAGLAQPPVEQHRDGWWRRVWTSVRGRLGGRRRRVSETEVLSSDGFDEPAEVLSVEEREIAAAIRSGSVEQLTQCLRKYPTAVLLYHAMGTLALNTGQLSEAITAFTRIIELKPESGVGYVLRGGVHCLAGSTQAGLADFNAAIERNPRDVDALASRALLYLDLEAWAIAENDLTEAIRWAPLQPRLYVHRARARYAQLKRADAESDVAHALHLDPYGAEALMLHGWMLLHHPAASHRSLTGAEECFSKAIEIEPQNLQYLIQRAEVYTSQGKFGLTIVDCDRVLELDDHNAAAWGLRGNAQRELGNYAEAIADCSKAIELGLQSPAVFLSRAVGYANVEDTDAALTDCDTALELAPDYAAAYHFRGMLRMQQEDVEPAQQDFEEASRLAPGWALPFAYGADVQRLQAKYEQAIEQYTHALELEPRNHAAYVGRALARIEMRQLEKAWEDLTTALQVDEDCVPAYFHRAQLSLRRERYDEALVDLDQAIRLDSEFTPAYHVRAQLCLQLRRPEQAVADFSRLIERHPTWSAPYVGRAHAWIDLEDAQRATVDYGEAARLEPGRVEELLVDRLTVEAHHLHRQEDYDAAAARATQALQQDEQNLAALAARAASYWYAERYVEALDDYTQLLELHNDLTFALAARGHVYAELGEYEPALADLDKAVSLARDAALEAGLAYALSSRGLAHAGLRRFEDARRDFEESVRLRPHNAWVHYHRGLLLLTLDDRPRATEAFREALRSEHPPLSRRKRERVEAFLQQQDRSTT